MTPIEASREYKGTLQATLAEAKRRYSTENYAVISIGLLAEISRVDLEIENIRLRQFVGASEGVPLFPRAIKLMQQVKSSIERNQGATVKVATSVTAQNRILRFELDSERAQDVIPTRLATFCMNRDLGVPCS